MVPLNWTYLNCLQNSLFEHIFNLYYYSMFSTNLGRHFICCYFVRHVFVCLMCEIILCYVVHYD